MFLASSQQSGCRLQMTALYCSCWCLDVEDVLVWLLCAAPVKSILFVKESFDLDNPRPTKLAMDVKEGEDVRQVSGHLLMRVMPDGKGGYQVHQPKRVVRSWRQLVEGATYMPAGSIAEQVASLRGTDPKSWC